MSPDLAGDGTPKDRPAATIAVVIAVAAATIITIAFANPSTHSYVQPTSDIEATSHVGGSMAAAPRG